MTGAAGEVMEVDVAAHLAPDRGRRLDRAATRSVHALPSGRDEAVGAIGRLLAVDFLLREGEE